MTGTPATPGSSAAAPPKQRVFLSYGHDEYEELATRLVDDLGATGRYEVWFDRHDILPGAQWEHALTEGLKWVADGPSAGWVILLMTPHSVRQPGGYCLNEIEYAREKELRLAPIMVVPVEVPLSIKLTQYLDMTDCVPPSQKPGRYQSAFERLCAALDQGDLAVAGEPNRLWRALQPPPCRTETSYDFRHFVPRRRLTAAFDAWLADPAAPQVFWIVGDLGTGKSTWSAWVGVNRSAVKAFHVCGRLDVPNTNARVAVRSIAWQLTTALPAYAERLCAIPELERVCKDEDVDLLDRLVIQPMHGLPAPERPVVVFIDAVDEAVAADVDTLADLLGREIPRLPPWLRFALTSARDPKVLVPLQAWTPLEIASESDDNVSEIREYVSRFIAPLSPTGTLDDQVLGTLLRVSECSWLYVDWVRRELEERRLTFDRVDAFPQGLGGVCHYELARRFPARDADRYRQRVRPILSVLAAASEPLPVAEYARLLGRPEADVGDDVRSLGGLVRTRNGRLRPFHYAFVAWLVDEARSGDHAVAVADGHRVLAADGWAQFERDPGGLRAYARTHLPRHLSEAGEVANLERCVTDARFIAARVGDDTVYDLARHWKRVPAERLRRLCRASHARLRSGHVEDAIAHRAALGTGQLFQQAGLYDDAVAYFEAALRAARRARDVDAAGSAELNLGWCLRHVDQFERAVRHADVAMKCFRDSGSREGQARTLSVRGMCWWHLREDLAALADLHAAATLYGECRDDRSRAEVLNHLGIVRRSLGLYDEALEALRDAKALYTRFKDARGLGKCLNSIGTALWWKGDLEGALECYRDADRVNEKVHQPYVLGLTANNRGYVYLEKAFPGEAYESFRRAREIRRQLGIASYELLDVSGMALASHRLQRREEAARLSAEAVAGLRRFWTVEDLERAYHNHYVITKDGTASQRASGALALRKAVALVNARLEKIADEAVVARFRAVPPVKAVLEAAQAMPPGWRGMVDRDTARRRRAARRPLPGAVSRTSRDGVTRSNLTRAQRRR